MPEMSTGESTMMTDASTGYGTSSFGDSTTSGRVVQLANPVRPANKLWGQARWKVPKWQYNKLKSHILKQQKKKQGTRRSSRSYGSAMDGHLGPIVITGRGGYFTDKFRTGASAAYRALQRGLPQGTFSRLGQAAGGAMFGGTGASLGRMAGSGLASVLGFGDYSISRNELLRLDEGVPVPTFADLNQGIVICHREYIGDVTQSTTFTRTDYPINPGLSKTFPWLSTIAPCFDQYEILGMLFQFRSTASDFGTTTNMAMGTLIMATEYDTADSAYQSKAEMENAQYALSGKPSQDMIHAIECDPSLVGPQGLKYVRTGGVPSGKDIRSYDHGLFQIATSGMPASTGTIGELWVTYKIAFYKPQLPLGTGAKTAYISAASWDSNNRFGIGAAQDPNNSIFLSISGNVLSITGGLTVGQTFLFIHTQQFASQAIAAGLVYTLSGLTSLELRQSNVGTLDNYVSMELFRITAENPTITLSNQSVATGQVVVRTYLVETDKDVIYSAFGLT